MNYGECASHRRAGGCVSTAAGGRVANLLRFERAEGDFRRPRRRGFRLGRGRSARSGWARLSEAWPICAGEPRPEAASPAHRHDARATRWAALVSTSRPASRTARTRAKGEERHTERRAGAPRRPGDGRPMSPSPRGRAASGRQNPNLSISTVATVMHLKQFLISKLRSDVSVSPPPLHSFPVCCRRS